LVAGGHAGGGWGGDSGRGSLVQNLLTCRSVRTPALLPVSRSDWAPPRIVNRHVGGQRNTFNTVMR
jgi:hypothetical protein